VMRFSLSRSSPMRTAIVQTLTDSATEAQDAVLGVETAGGDADCTSLTKFVKFVRL